MKGGRTKARVRQKWRAGAKYRRRLQLFKLEDPNSLRHEFKTINRYVGIGAVESQRDGVADRPALGGVAVCAIITGTFESRSRFLTLPYVSAPYMQQTYVDTT